MDATTALLLAFGGAVGSLVATYIVGEVSGMLTQNRAINSIANTTSMSVNALNGTATAGINAIMAAHNVTAVSNHSVNTNNTSTGPAGTTSTTSSTTQTK